MFKIKNFLIWSLICLEGLMLLYSPDERNKFNSTFSYFYQFEDELWEVIADDIRYLVGIILLLPLIAWDSIFVKFLVVVFYSLQIVVTENLYIRSQGQWKNINIQQFLPLAIKLILLLFAFESLAMSILDYGQDISSKSITNHVTPIIINQGKELKSKTKTK